MIDRRFQGDCDQARNFGAMDRFRFAHAVGRIAVDIGGEPAQDQVCAGATEKEPIGFRLV